MASQEQVRQYLAYWFQLGKRLVVENHEMILPDPVIQGDRYSAEFEACWQRILDSKHKDFYLEGTHQTIAELLSPCWDVLPCVRCEMPVPMMCVGFPSDPSCPCFDLPSWPNLDLPRPRSPVNSHTQLNQIRERLLGSLRVEPSTTLPHSSNAAPCPFPEQQPSDLEES